MNPVGIVPFVKHAFGNSHMLSCNFYCFWKTITGISLQEAIYGTKLLARLESIKEAIDPDYMFDCYKCIGNNRAKSKTTVEDDQSKEGEAQADIDGNADGDSDGDMNGEDSPEEAIAVSSSDGGCLSIRKFSFFTLLSFVGFFLV